MGISGIILISVVYYLNRVIYACVDCFKPYVGVSSKSISHFYHKAKDNQEMKLRRRVNLSFFANGRSFKKDRQHIHPRKANGVFTSP